MLLMCAIRQAVAARVLVVISIIFGGADIAINCDTASLTRMLMDNSFTCEMFPSNGSHITMSLPCLLHVFLET